MTIDVNTIQSLGLNDLSQATKKRNELGQEQFLKLMVTQLTTQNPLKPQDGAEFLGQLAQFSIVSGIQHLQSSFDQFANSLGGAQALQASQLIGRSVLVDSKEAFLQSGKDLKGIATLPSEAADLSIRISDTRGNPVTTFRLGPQAAGEVAFTWDGTGDDGLFAGIGRYRVEAEAVIDGKNTALATSIYAPVESVSLGANKGIEIELAGLGRYAFTDVREIATT